MTWIRNKIIMQTS